MSAYAIVDIEVIDAAAYEGYKEAAERSIAKHGGRYLARGGATAVVEGDWKPRRLVILEFPSMAKLRAWYDSDDYRDALALRKRAAVSKFVVVEGV